MHWRLIIVALALVLAGCETAEEQVLIQGTQMPVDDGSAIPAQNTTLEQTPETTVNQPEDSTIVQNSDSVADETEEQGFYERQPEEPPSIAKYKAVFSKEVKNYQFTNKNNKWLVAGKRAKMIPSRVIQRQYNAPFIDTIYFDLENKTAFGVCEGNDKSIMMQCVQLKVLGVPFAMPYVQYRVMLPEDWLNEFQNLFMNVADSPKLVTDRETVHLKHQSNTKIIDIYIDPESGLPVAVVNDGVEYQYSQLSKNSIKPNEKMIAE